MSIIPWRRDGLDPFALHADMDRLFETLWRGFDVAQAFGRTLEGAATWAPRITVSETDAEIRVDTELPGLTEKDFEVVLEGSLLTLKGEKHSEQETKDAEVRHVERGFGRFERAIELPCDVEADKVSANYKNGVLRVTLPKLDPAKRGVRQIEVRSA
jgi:HSP20 family protein